MHKLKWKDEGSCLDYDTNLFFDKYEESENFRSAIDKLCSECPVMKTCFSVGVSQKEWGVWGGVYLESGEVSKEFNSHRSQEDWNEVWIGLTNER
jgi:hypothetical protein